jgi:hypothetical protein
MSADGASMLPAGAKALNALGGATGAYVGVLLGGLATAAVAAAGITLSVPIAGIIGLAAALVGGIYGAEGAKRVWEIYDNHNENDKMGLPEKYAELIFGTATKLDEIPDILIQYGGRLEYIRVDLLDEKAIAHEAGKADGIAWRYALKELNPFVITGVDYAALSQDGKYDLYDPVSGKGAMTSEYIQMRAQMLYWRLEFDRQGLLYSQQMNTDREGNWDFIDKSIKDFNEAPDLKLEIDGDGRSLYDHQVVFGSGKNELLEGSGDDDWLFGGDGDDQLRGKDGANYLEGGRGSDIYYVTDDGETDTIRDVDGQGVIYLDDIKLTGGKAADISVNGFATRIWTSEDGEIEYHRDGTTLSVIKDGKVEISILDYDFQNNTLGERAENTFLIAGPNLDKTTPRLNLEKDLLDVLHV